MNKRVVRCVDKPALSTAGIPLDAYVASEAFKKGNTERNKE